jgi:uncharacterized membrane protein YhaH (DUF805 family)
MSNPSAVDLTALLFSFEGRIPRSTYWLWYCLPYVVIYLLTVLIDIAAGTYNASEGIGVVSGLFVLLALYPSIAVAVKRCHDRDRSGWFLLVGIIPLVNLWVLVELGFLRGTVGPNRYGPDPLTE